MNNNPMLLVSKLGFFFVCLVYVFVARVAQAQNAPLVSEGFPADLPSNFEASDNGGNVAQPIAQPQPLGEYDFVAPKSVSPAIAPNPLVTPPPPNFSPTTNSNGTMPRGYRVEVMNASPLLLAKVQKIEPQAFMRQGDRVIQAGIFSRADNAQERLRTLQREGISGQIVEVGFNANAQSQRSPGGYFVAIPSSGLPLETLLKQVQSTGIPPSLLQAKTAPRGPHVAIGPFPTRTEADKWNQAVRGVGFDGRLYFQD